MACTFIRAETLGVSEMYLRFIIVKYNRGTIALAGGAILISTLYEYEERKRERERERENVCEQIKNIEYYELIRNIMNIP